MAGLLRIAYHAQSSLQSNGGCVLFYYPFRYFNSNHGNQDYYKILKVKRNASQKEIKSAFLHQSKKWHPDVNKSPEASAKFVEIVKAYKVLSAPKSRKQYDRCEKRGMRYEREHSANATSTGETHYRQHGWEGKGYWQWTEEEEMEFRKYFYENYGMGKYGKNFEAAAKDSDVSTFEKFNTVILCFCAGVVTFIVFYFYIKMKRDEGRNLSPEEMTYLQRITENLKQRALEREERLNQRKNKGSLFEMPKKSSSPSSLPQEEKHALHGILDFPKEQTQEEIDYLQRRNEFIEKLKPPEYEGLRVPHKITPLKLEHQLVEIKDAAEEHSSDKAQVLDPRYIRPPQVNKDI